MVWVFGVNRSRCPAPYNLETWAHFARRADWASDLEGIGGLISLRLGDLDAAPESEIFAIVGALLAQLFL